MIEKQLEELLKQSGYFLMTYRSIDALKVLQDAIPLVDTHKVPCQMKAAVFRNIGQAYMQMGKQEEGLPFLIRSYETLEDRNEKAAGAVMIAKYYLRDGKLDLAVEYAAKAQDLATEPDMLADSLHLQGGIADYKGDYPKAVEMMTRAAELAENAHCTMELAIIIMDLSTVFYKMGMKETALSEIYRAERYVKECHDLDLFMRCAVRRARILFAMGMDEEAKKLIIALDEQKS